MKAREHLGRVVRAEGDKAIVEVQVSGPCGFAFRCACCASLRREPLTIQVDRDGLEEGQTVRVAMPGYLGYLSTFVVFGLPVLLFVAGILVGGLLEGGTEARGILSAAGGVFGFLLGVLVAVVVDRRLAGSRSFRVSRVEEHEA